MLWHPMHACMHANPRRTLETDIKFTGGLESLDAPLGIKFLPFFLVAFRIAPHGSLAVVAGLDLKKS